MPKNVVILANPAAGRGRSKKLIQHCRQAGHFCLYESTSLQHLRQLVRENLRAHTLVALGGDSTFFFVLNEALKHGFRGNFAFLPAGTANDLARQTQITTYAKHLVAWEKQNFQPFDLIELSWKNPSDTIENTFFVVGQFNVGVGALVNQKVHAFYAKKPAFKKWIPPLLPGLQAFQQAARQPPLEAHLKWGTSTIHTQASILLFSNIAFWSGGKRFVPLARTADGVAELTILPAVSLWHLTRLYLQAGSHWYFSKSGARFFHFQKLHLELKQEALIQAEGEIIGTAKQLKAQVLPQKIKLLFA